MGWRDWFRPAGGSGDASGALVAPWEGGESQYSFLLRHLDPASGRLAPEGLKLPDEPAPSPRRVSFAPGAFDGAVAHFGAGGRERRAAALHEAIRKAAHERTPAALRALHRLVSAEDAIQDVDALLARIHEIRDVKPERLLSLALWLATQAPDRATVKFAMALLGLVPDEGARKILVSLGKHEEFTLYAAVALQNTLDEPAEALWELARAVEGWGRIQAIRRLAKSTHPGIRAWLLREGYQNSIMNEYTALICAETGGLLEALRASAPDRELLRGAGQLLEALIAGRRGPEEGIDDYADGAEAARLLVQHLAACSLDLDDLLSVVAIRDFLAEDDADGEARAKRGWTPELCAQLRQQCEVILADRAWPARIEAGLRAEDEGALRLAARSAQALGIDAWPRLFERLERPGEGTAWLWFEVARTRDPQRFQRVVELALRRLPLERIATGPDQSFGLGPEYDSHLKLTFVLQELRNSPGQGWELIRAGLASPVVANRNMAIAALETWRRERWGTEVEPALRTALEREPDEQLRERIRKVLRGEAVAP